MKHVFFDLDHTLWDFETNSRETLNEMFWHFDLDKKGISSVNHFIDVYEAINQNMWALYSQHKISKEELRNERFKRAFIELGIPSKSLAHSCSEYYIFNTPRKTNLFENTHFILDYLKPKFQLHIITNGFEEVQHIKLNRSGLEDYFTHVVTSEMTGKRKPNPKIFNHALQLTGAVAEESVMIGDDLKADVIGAMNVGLKGVYFNPRKEKHDIDDQHNFEEIFSLKELKNIL